MAVLQQFTGINAVIYYADKIFAAAGFSTPAGQSLATLWAIGAVNVVATFVAVAWVDRFGRKPLLLVGSVGMGAQPDRGRGHVRGAGNHGHGPRGDGTSVTGIVTLDRLGGVHRLVRLLAGSGGVDDHQRDLPHPTCGAGRWRWPPPANWFAAWAVSQFFLSLVDLITEAGTFWLFAGFCGVTYVFVRRFVPETKGKSLEQVELLWSDPAAIRRAIGSPTVRP